MRPSFIVRLTLAFTLFALAPSAAQAQQPPPAQEPPTQQTTVTREQITAYAQAFVSIGTARDEAQAQLAQQRNKTPEAQKHLQDALRERIAEILTEHELTEARYRQLTWVVSAQPEQKKLFEEILEALTKKTGTN